MAYDAYHWVEYLELAVEDIDGLYADLRKLGKLDWATSLVDSVAHVQDQIESFVTHVDKESFTLFWRIETSQDEGALRLLYENDGNYPDTTFSTFHKKEIDIPSRHERRTRLITAKDVTRQVQSKIRDYLDQLLIDAGIREQHQL